MFSVFRDRRRTIKRRVRRAVRAWRYFSGRLSADDAQTIILDCQDAAGWYEFSTLAVDDVLEQAQDIFADHPDLPKFVAAGCVRVWRLWEGSNHQLDLARDWALEAAQEIAADAGVLLARRADEADEV